MSSEILDEMQHYWNNVEIYGENKITCRSLALINWNLTICPDIGEIYRKLIINFLTKGLFDCLFFNKIIFLELLKSVNKEEYLRSTIQTFETQPQIKWMNNSVFNCCILQSICNSPIKIESINARPNNSIV